MTAADPDAAGPLAPWPVVRAADLPTRDGGAPWLVEELWAAEAVGIIGGTPKSCKTWLALELAVAVASGRDALGRFPVAAPGPVLAYGAEDGPAQLRERLLAITRARTLDLAAVDLFLLTTPTLRLDCPRDRARLTATIERLRPRLLLLDPFVRLHRADENSAADMAALLGELRALQRHHRLAIMVVHHLRKNAAASLGGQALRGSGDLHAWGDSNLYLRRRDAHLTLCVEHRAAAAPDPFRLILAEHPAPHLEVVDADGTAPDPRGADHLAARVLELLRRTAGARTRDAIRIELQVRNATLGQALARLRAQDLITRSPEGFAALDPRSLPVPVPVTTSHTERNARAAGETAGPLAP